MSVAFVPPLMCSCCNRRRITWNRVGTDPRVAGIINAVLLSTGISVTTLMSRNQTRRVAMTRALIATRVGDELGDDYGPSEIGKLLNRDHSSIIAMQRKVRKMRRG